MERALKQSAIAEFRADFPDDHEEDGLEITLLGGRGVAQHIAAKLTELGLSVDPPEEAQPYGWRFDVHSGRGRAMIQITDLDGSYKLMIDEKTSILTRAFHPKASIWVTLVEMLHDLFLKNALFSNIQWWDDFSQKIGPFDRPVSRRQKAPE